MATGTKQRPDETALNPAERDAAVKLSPAELAKWDQIEAGLRDDMAADSAEHESLASREGGFEFVGSSASKKPAKKTERLLAQLVKRRGVAAGGLTIGTLIIIAILTLINPAFGLQHLAENLTLTGDSGNTVMQRQLSKVIGAAISPEDCKGSKLCSKMNQMSYPMLRRLAKAGITPMNTDGPMEIAGRGYAKERPTSWRIERGDKTITVSSSEFMTFLSRSENRDIAAKVLGRRGVLGLALEHSLWNSRYLNKKLFSKFKVVRNGGIAAKADGKDNANDRIEKYRKNIPSTENINDSVVSKVKSKMEGHLNKIKRAGLAYTVPASSCIAVKAPRIIAGAYAAAQLLPLMPLASDLILSPASRAKAVGAGSGFSAEDMETVGTMMTKKVPRPSDKKLTAFVDSKYLQAAAGFNKTKLRIHDDFAPGYAVLKNKAFQGISSLEDSSKGACDIILSPTAMYSAMAVDAAVTVAASGMGVGLLKIVGSYLISEVVSFIGQQAAGAIAKAALAAIVNTDAIKQAEGEALGDAVGISAMAFFSSSAMSQHLPILPVNKVKEFASLRADSEQLQREMDIASLSPFDTSSRYTFLGSIAHNTAQLMITSGFYGRPSAVSVLSSLFRMPLALSSPIAKASDVSAAETYCSYAEDFGMKPSVDGQDIVPGINNAGFGCHGSTAAQDAMEPSEVIAVAEAEGWLDNSVAIGDEDDLDDLLSKGFIKKDTPLADFMESCGDPTSGDHLYNAASCMTGAEYTSSTTSHNSIKLDTTCVTRQVDGVTKQVCPADAPKEAAGSSVSVASSRALAAAPVLLWQYQVHQAVMGFAWDESGRQSASSAATAGPGEWAVSPNHDGNIDKRSSAWNQWVQSLGGNGENKKGALKPITTSFPQVICPSSNSLNAHGGGNLFHPNAAKSGQALLEAYHNDPANKGRYLVPSACFRSYAAQEQAWNNYQRGGNLAAQPGSSNHGWGLAIDFRSSSSPTGFETPITSFSSPDYLWLKNNAYKYGWINPKSMQPGRCSGSGCEAWHFQYVGPL